jgi:serine/threonine-protein kinase
MTAGEDRPVERVVGRYALYGEIASGGMATVHFGRLQGPVGFSRTVAIKRLHPQFAKDPEFVSMFLDEARLAARIQHPNVVATLDVVALEGELFLVMEYVQGESLARLIRNLRQLGARIPPRVVGSIMAGVLYGLHAAHEAKSERGQPLGIVHRDVSPQNILVGSDGVTRVLDFGVAKAAGRVQTTREGQIKGKLAYMAPEQIRGFPVDRRTDVYGAAVVLWEALTNRRLFDGEHEGIILHRVLEGEVHPPSRLQPDLPTALDMVVMRGLSRDPGYRFQSAREMAVALEDVMPMATSRAVGEWLEQIAGDSLARRAERVKEIESVSSSGQGPGGLTLIRSGSLNPTPAGVATPLPFGPHGPPASLSQVSSISVSKPRTVSPPVGGRSRRVLALLGSLAAIGVVVAVLNVRSGAAPDPVAGESIDAPAGVAAGPPAPTPPPTPEASAPPAASVATSATPAATTSSAVATTARPPPRPSPRPKPVAAPDGKPKTVSPTAAAPPNCNPPYTVDAAGIRRIKPECL